MFQNNQKNSIKGLNLLRAGWIISSAESFEKTENDHVLKALSSVLKIPAAPKIKVTKQKETRKLLSAAFRLMALQAF